MYVKIMQKFSRHFASIAGHFSCAVALSFFAGCASFPKQDSPAPAAAPPANLVWPQPPDPPRIAHVRSISGPADLGIKPSGVTRFGSWLTGSRQSSDQLVKPFGILLDENDNLCLTDAGALAVCYFDRAHHKWLHWEKIGKLRFVAPVAIARHKGVFYVADSGRASVVAFDEGGHLRCEITNHLLRPCGLAISATQLFVADSKRHCIVVFGLNGEFISEFGRRGAGPGEFNFPTHIAADSEGNLYVTDSMNSRVQILDGNHNFKANIGSIGDRAGQFSRPKGVAVDSFGHVYVIDGMFDNLQVFDRQGHLLLTLGEAGTGPGQFWLPNGIAISRQNEIYVTDSYNRRVQVFKYVGAE
jgi:sugar lactone lactonase YvrE